MAPLFLLEKKIKNLRKGVDFWGCSGYNIIRSVRKRATPGDNMGV